MVHIQKEDLIKSSCPKCDLSVQMIVKSWTRGDVVKHDSLFRVCEEETRTGKANIFYFHFDERP